MLAAMRFILVTLLGVVLLKRPQCPMPWLICYGLTISFGQFALLFWAMSIGFPAGLASLLLQIQAFITATVFYKERLEKHHIYAAIIAALGVYILVEAQGNAVSLNGFSLILVISAATCWAMGNGQWAMGNGQYNQ